VPLAPASLLGNACSEMPARLAAWLPGNFTIFVGTSGIQRPIIGRAVTGLDVR
jgi:hypothetical protein